jgi:hypothetical protein
MPVLVDEVVDEVEEVVEPVVVIEEPVVVDLLDDVVPSPPSPPEPPAPPSSPQAIKPSGAIKRIRPNLRIVPS